VEQEEELLFSQFKKLADGIASWASDKLKEQACIEDDE